MDATTVGFMLFVVTPALAFFLTALSYKIEDWFWLAVQRFVRMRINLDHLTRDGE